ncbi:MAG TPA: TIGR02996 domain-containing protein, partial [Gemmataceae bacterium]|nr:TIGR02996 domain-containing protein [Gemmataceae bacterium]
MTDGDALLAAILAEPDEDTPRLMYADWLEEEGRRERAEFIRTQIALARTPERDVVPWNPRVVALRATEKRILALRFAEWIAAMRELRAARRTRHERAVPPRVRR